MSSRVIRGGTATPDVIPLTLDRADGITQIASSHGQMTIVDAPQIELSTPDSVPPSSHVIAQLEKRAYELGFRDGQKSGGDTAEKATAPLLEQLASSVEELRSQRRTIFATSEREVIRLALEIARKVVKREIAIDEEIVLTLVRVALKRVSDQTLMTIRLNPKDCSVVKRFQAMGNPAEELNEGIQLIEDPAISRGGCVIETESGLVDARVEEQFREIEKGFLD